jgi:hypothetical protein
MTLLSQIVVTGYYKKALMAICLCIALFAGSGSVRGQGPEVRDQKSGIRSQGSGVRSSVKKGLNILMTSLFIVNLSAVTNTAQAGRTGFWFVMWLLN